ncbi:hypothetical protein ACELLULO517_12235 [Acidisoma cellulosilytica]|uniref:Uncharacterized protein n=1 Tax=Acidisoma cellulosilyticum TaxID=2802395 RepID=A0A963Z1H9_9PROT|nr:hypothetical protein [Acidisoma cellulosilyticum]MCB8881005.1 hypothetical protein [Acidisoma cellulosilyticum]
MILPSVGAVAQTLGYGSPAQVTIDAVKVFKVTSADNSKALAMLAALSAEAGIPFIAKPDAQPVMVAVSLAHPQDVTDPALCIRAGVSVNPAVMSGPPMTLEHGLVGCPTDTAGIPVVLVQDPALAPPPTSRAGQYDVDVTLHYRLMERDRVKLIASLTEQGLAYTMDSAISGNNFLAALTMDF